jgi:DNA repair protein RadC
MEQPQPALIHVHVGYPAPPERDQPVNRLMRDGATACSSVELLQVLIGGPNAEALARAVMARFPTMKELSHATWQELTALGKGIGQAKALAIKAAAEWGRRMAYATQEQRTQIKAPGDAATLLMSEMGILEQEEVRTLLLDARNRVIGAPMIYRGSLTAASMRIGELFKEAIRNNAAAVIVAHNHPSGEADPSAEDVRVTRVAADAGKLLDIQVLDHIVIAQNGYVSPKERGLGFE